MALQLALENREHGLSPQEWQPALIEAWRQLGPRKHVLAIPPDFTRFPSQAGPITCLAYEHYGEALTDVMPALGTHVPMPDWQLERMFPTLPKTLIRHHDWRNDVETIGEVPAEFVHEVTEGIFNQPWPAQLNQRVWRGGHDLILSIGQVVPHEVIGMANYNKNLFVGTGGVSGINESHFIGAAYGMERMMGRTQTPLRRILNEAQRLFCQELPLVFVLTVVSVNPAGEFVMNGLYMGDDQECFERAAELSREVNFTLLDERPQKVVVYLDPEEFHSTWLGNKAIYRTRMAIADGGQLIILAPGVKSFGEDAEIDRLIRRYGYRTSDEILALVQEHAELRENLSAAAHLIHGSSENRFTVTYCPGELTRAEIEGVGYQYGDLREFLQKYPPDSLAEGYQQLPDGERVFFIKHPALGLWASRDRFED
jgi:nickel-dependent lactate racemase